ncbi:MAG: SDR family NAD(P)-dependent oxidoreductase, partial [Oligoflexales bacterium]|nr:SDR family NAD(P)-dependent oxidoreductase [Oligoflexales bacterium]
VGKLATLGIGVDTEILYADRDARFLDLDSSLFLKNDQKNIWYVNGYSAWPADGSNPGHSIKDIGKTARINNIPVVAGDRDEIMVEYLRSMREIVSAQRDVMITLLAGNPSYAVQPPVVADVSVSRDREPVRLTQPEDEKGKEAKPEEKKESISDMFLSVVSEKTGYPLDMLDPDLKMEADLGIDSIKRIEILSKFFEMFPGRNVSEEDVQKFLKELSKLKTLREICELLTREMKESGITEAVSGEAERGGSISGEADIHPIRRFDVIAREYEFRDEKPGLIAGKRIVITEDGYGIAKDLTKKLRRSGYDVLVLDKLADKGFDPALSYLVHLSSIGRASKSSDVKAFFPFLKKILENDLRHLAVFTSFGGGRFSPVSAIDEWESSLGYTGLLKTAIKEYPGLSARVVDINLKDNRDEIVDKAYDIITFKDMPVSMALSQGVCHVPVYRERPFDGAPAEPMLLDEKSVVLLTGGGKGITGKIALELARRYRCSLHIVGRSSLKIPADMENFLKFESRNDLRRMLIESGIAKPSVIEEKCNEIIGVSELHSNLREMRRHSPHVKYHALDIRGTKAFGSLIDSIYKKHGRLDALIHGAGILNDKLIRDKQPEHFSQVFDTKVKGAICIARNIRREIKYVMFLSSIVGEFGNMGQSDYAAANSALDQIARWINKEIDGKSISINWGPWKGGGMVSDELQRLYEREGIYLLDPDEALAALFNEFGIKSHEGSQVVMMCGEPDDFIGMGKSKGMSDANVVA